jgi:hypothetical protein
VTAQGGDRHVRTLFHLGDRRFLDEQDLGQRLLRKAVRLTQLIERHFGQQRMRLGVGAIPGLGRHLRP